MERTVEAVNRRRQGRQGIKRRDLELKYPKEKCAKLCDMLKSRGMFYYDPDFPDDPED